MEQQQPETAKKPKERFQEILMEVFELIEGSVPEGIYLQVGNQLKEANDLLTQGEFPATPQIQIRIIELVREARRNTYYRRFANKPSKVRHHLTEAEKAKSDKYSLCSCGRYINNTDPDYLKEHLETSVHFQGLRNKKLAVKKGETEIDEEVQREVMLTGFCLNHLSKRQEEATASNP